MLWPVVDALARRVHGRYKRAQRQVGPETKPRHANSDASRSLTISIPDDSATTVQSIWIGGARGPSELPDQLQFQRLSGNLSNLAKIGVEVEGRHEHAPHPPALRASALWAPSTGTQPR